MFLFNNVSFKKFEGSDLMLLKGEACNDTKKDFNTAVFKVNLYAGSSLVWTGIFKLRNFKRRQTRPFEVSLDNIKAPTVEAVTKSEIVYDSGY